MQIQYNISNYNSFKRLTTADITRHPLHKNSHASDVFCKKISQNNCPTTKKNAFWKKIFAAAPFAITALYIAHRSNLFNPVRREAKRIIKNQNLITKVKGFVDNVYENWDDTCRKATKNLLQQTIDKVPAQKNAQNTKTTVVRNILNDNNIFNDLFKKVSNALKDEELVDGKIKDTVMYKNGYTADILDSLLRKTEKILANRKSNKQPYKDIHDEVIAKIFEQADGKESIVSETLQSIIQRRSSSTVDSFIQDLVINGQQINLKS